MKFVLERIKLLMHVPVVTTLLVAGLALGVGVWKSAKLFEILWNEGPQSLTPLHFLHAMDSFLIAAVLILFAVGLHVLFIGKLDLPEVFQAESLHDLESKIGSLVVLVMALFTLERFMEAPTDPSNLPMAGAFAVVTLGIIAFNVHKRVFRGGRSPKPRFGRHRLDRVTPS